MPRLASRLVAQERASLVELLHSLGPEAATLCDGWTTRDLAAHLILRERRVDAAPGILVRSLAAHTARVQARLAAQPWPALLARLARRPLYLAMPGAETAMNLVEYFIHHEDVRRAQPGWSPRDVPDLAAALWPRVGGLGPRRALRRTPAAVRVTSPGLGAVTLGRGGPEVTLEGPPGELLLFLTGRQAHAHVTLTGPSAIIDRMRTSRYGV